jgi:hypothetical protein
MTSTTTVTTTPAALKVDDISALPYRVVKWLATIVQAGHKEASFLSGLLVAFGVTPTTMSANSQHIVAAILMGYSAITHAAAITKGTSS